MEQDPGPGFKPWIKIFKQNFAFLKCLDRMAPWVRSYEFCQPIQKIHTQKLLQAMKIQILKITIKEIKSSQCIFDCDLEIEKINKIKQLK